MKKLLKFLAILSFAIFAKNTYGQHPPVNDIFSTQEKDLELKKIKYTIVLSFCSLITYAISEKWAFLAISNILPYFCFICLQFTLNNFLKTEIVEDNETLKTLLPITSMIAYFLSLRVMKIFSQNIEFIILREDENQVPKVDAPN